MIKDREVRCTISISEVTSMESRLLELLKWAENNPGGVLSENFDPIEKGEEPLGILNSEQMAYAIVLDQLGEELHSLMKKCGPTAGCSTQCLNIGFCPISEDFQKEFEPVNRLFTLWHKIFWFIVHEDKRFPRHPLMMLRKGGVVVAKCQEEVKPSMTIISLSDMMKIFRGSYPKREGE